MASLQARSPLRSAHPLIVVNKLISLIAFIVLLGAGWVALSYLKSEVVNRWRGASQVNSSAAPTKTVRVNETDTLEGKRLAVPVKLVYSCTGDGDNYHSSAHLPVRCQRTALSEEAALQRNLKPCPVCMVK